MVFNLTPKAKRNLYKILPFGVIWFTSSMLFLFIEQTATGYQNLNPSSEVTVTFPVLIFASIAVTFVGLLVGFMETLVIEKRFSQFSFGKKNYLQTPHLSFTLLIDYGTYFPYCGKY